MKQTTRVFDIHANLVWEYGDRLQTSIGADLYIGQQRYIVTALNANVEGLLVVTVKQPEYPKLVFGPTIVDPFTLTDCTGRVVNLPITDIVVSIRDGKVVANLSVEGVEVDIKVVEALVVNK